MTPQQIVNKLYAECESLRDKISELKFQYEETLILLQGICQANNLYVTGE